MQTQNKNWHEDDIETYRTDDNEPWYDTTVFKKVIMTENIMLAKSCKMQKDKMECPVEIVWFCMFRILSYAHFSRWLNSDWVSLIFLLVGLKCLDFDFIFLAY